MLSSELFRGCSALQDCAVKDSAHVTPGSRGDSVARIQRALGAIDEAEIDEREIADRLYGTTTTAAVLAYKRARSIINPAYQQTADNIVGKMTIVRLDADMLDLQRRLPGENIRKHLRVF
jgi:peptidoglycan hydrolase-like protein with peptidoglycan-binding domain